MFICLTEVDGERVHVAYAQIRLMRDPQATGANATVYIPGAVLHVTEDAMTIRRMIQRDREHRAGRDVLARQEAERGVRP